MAYETPLQRLNQLSDSLRINLWSKRDDLYAFIGGGNKARKMQRIASTARSLGCDSLVTTGGAQSNHARVTALLAAQEGWRCKLVLHGDPEELSAPKGNLLLMLLSGAEIEVVTPDKIASAMQHSMDALRAEGCHPYEVIGGGHCLDGTLAYHEAVLELDRQCQASQWFPDWIIHASGTGTTQAGIVGGVDALGWDTHVVGISVARRNPRGRQVVIEVYDDLRKHLGMVSPASDIDFRDGWIGEGYEKTFPAVYDAIKLAGRAGLVLDPTYTGKAFAALIEMTRTGEIPVGANVLFWHTGGMLNLLAHDGIGGKLA